MTPKNPNSADCPDPQTPLARGGVGDYCPECDSQYEPGHFTITIPGEEDENIYDHCYPEHRWTSCELDALAELIRRS